MKTTNELVSVGSLWHKLCTACKRQQPPGADQGSKVRRSSTSVISALLLIMLVMVQASIGVHAQTIQNVTYYHNNIQGTPIAATDEQGSVLWQQEYSPYGLPRGSASQQSAAALNTVDYTGHVRDKDAGTSLVYMGARHYDPVLGRFLSMDPVQPVDGVPESVNRYAYANNNPYRYVDPDGEFPVLIIAYWAAVGALTAYDTYNAYQRGGVGGAAVQLATDAALSAVGGVAIAKTLKAGSHVASSAQKLLTHSPSIKFFKGDEAVLHFSRHADEFMRAFGRDSYNLKNYLDDAKNVIQNGKFVPEMNGYIKLIGGKGSAKYGFVGLDRMTGNMTTFHLKSVSEIARKAPGMGISK